MAYKLGSLFDGSGGFPLAGSLCGIVPVWAAEVEPYPIAVTKSRFPGMAHLGDISKVNGAKIEPVDIITFGSPCQDLSVAGKRAGLKHEANGDEETTRSGLFMEAVRIIKEMREATNGRYPTFALWENVPGAFTSNKGEDFRTVLEELIKIVEPSAIMPPVPAGGWAYADSYRGNGWSLAYRVFDAQYWGVPQRRRRIHLVVDFRGRRAQQVLFEREGLRGNPPQSGTAWQAPPGYAESCPRADDSKGGLEPVVDECILDDQGGQQITVRTDGKAPTLRAEMHGNVPCVMQTAAFKAGNGAKAQGIGYEEEISPSLTAAASGTNQVPACIYCVENHPADSRVDITDTGVVQTLTSRMGTGGGNVPMVMECKTASFLPQKKAESMGFTQDDVSGTLHNGACPGYQNAVVIPIHDQATRFAGKHGDKTDGKGNGLGVGNEGDPMNTLTSGDRHAVAYCLGNGQVNQAFTEEVAGTLNCMHDQQAVVCGVDCRNCTEYPEVNGTLQAKANGGQSLNCNQVVRVCYIVRRLTPTECARLQGFLDRWGTPDPKTEFTDEEFLFWLNVRNTHAAINGKAVKEYTPAQMLVWYNKLHTDSAEYKMWGNGIALPPALYCMQGMAEALEEEDDEWML